MRSFLKLIAIGAMSAALLLLGVLSGLNIARATQPPSLSGPADLKSIVIVAVHPFGQAGRPSNWPDIFTQYHIQFLDRTTAFNDVGFHIDQGYVEQAHQLGALTASYFSQDPLELPGWAFSQRYYAQLPPDQRWKNPDGSVAEDPYESSAGRNVLGEIMWAFDRTRAVMSECSPYWLDYQKKSISWALSQGLDAIDIDLIPNVPFSESRGGDFNGWCVNAFRQYLGERYSTETLISWGIEDITRFDVRNYFLSRPWAAWEPGRYSWSGEPYFKTDPLDLPLSDPIVREFYKFQYHTHIQYVRTLVEYAHELGQSQGRFVPFFGNLNIGHPPGEVLGLANPSIIIGQVVDIIQIETIPAVPPAGRLTTHSKLGWAMGNYEKPVWNLHEPFYGYGFEPKIPQGNPMITLHQLYIAENYATGVIPEIDLGGWPGVPGPRGLFLKDGQPIPEIRNYMDFVWDNKDLLRADQQPLSNVALVYSIPTFMWHNMPLFWIWYHDAQRAAFAGYARALEEAHIQYDVLIFGHPELWDDQEALTRLSRYSAVILPDVDCISDAQAAALVDYVRRGGKLIVVENPTRKVAIRTEDYVLRNPPALQPVLMNPGKGQILSVPLEVAKGYFENIRQGRQDPSSFNRLIAPLKAETQFIHVNAPSTVGINAWRQAERLILHLVNYDYNMNSDLMSPTENIKISIPYRKLDLPQPTSVRLFSPDLDSPQDLSFSREGDTISFSVHQLKVWDVVVISSSGY